MNNQVLQAYVARHTTPLQSQQAIGASGLLILSLDCNEGGGLRRLREGRLAFVEWRARNASLSLRFHE